MDAKRDFSNFDLFLLLTYQPKVWKFHNSSITKILREINFEDSRSEKSAETHLKALNFDFMDFYNFRSA